MIAQRLSLGGFRNLRETSLSFSEGVNVFYGDNAQGKTNLLEAIWMFTGARSFRTPREKNLIAFGREQASLRLSFSSYGREENEALLKRLKGTKILIMGNHDTGYSPEEWRKMGFLECSRWPILYEGFFLLSHEPLYINRNMPYANIYGHVHNNPSYRDASSQSVCVSVERIRYCPEAFEAIREKMRG